MEKSERMRERSYRADIDGLRAVAVLLVLLFHLDVETLSGGFVGVDIFFVISGYLITQIILSELARGDFSIWRFYERRIRRIFPALFAMIAVTTAFAYWLLLPIDFKNFGQSVAAATLFSSNLLFIFEAGYFDADAELKPLLHTWSLAVEEQFYLIFPPIIALVWWWGRKHLIWVVGAITLISFVGAEWSASRFPVTTFFLSPPRFWELLLGAFLAMSRTVIWPATLSILMSWVGLTALLSASLLYEPQTRFPGVAALLPCLGALVLIQTGRSQVWRWSANELLAWRPLVFIGLLSYSIYLWHWPLIVLVKYVTVDGLALLDQWALGVGSLGLAYLSWRWVETPFRRRQLLARQWPTIGAGIVAMIAVSAVGIVIALNQGFPGRVPPAIALLERDQLYVNYRQDCRPQALAEDAICIRGDVVPEPNFLLLGDSHAGSISPGVFQAARGLGIAGVQLTVPSYRPFLDFGRRGFEQLDHQVDAELIDILDQVESIQTILIVAYWQQAIDVGYNHLQSGEFRPQDILDTGLSSLVQAYPDRHFLIMRDFPIDDSFGANRYARQRWFGHAPNYGLAREEHEASTAETTRQLERLGQHTNVSVLSLDSVFCGPRFCQSIEDGRSLYRDADHLSLVGALKTAPFFQEVLGQVPARPAHGD